MKDFGHTRQYACFQCRKSFKRKQFSAAYYEYMTSDQIKGQKREEKKFNEQRIYKCPDCGEEVNYMGTDFKAPKKNDKKAWVEVEKYIKSGKIYYRNLK